MSTTYVTDGTACITLKPNGQRRGDGWCLQPNWTQHGEWVATKREAAAAARELLKARKAHVASIRVRAAAAVRRANVPMSVADRDALIQHLTEEFSK